MAQFAYVQESRKKTRQKQTPLNAPPASHGKTRLSRKKKRRVDKQKNKENRQGLERRLRMTLVLHYLSPPFVAWRLRGCVQES